MHCNASWFNIHLQYEASEHLIYANPGISVFKISLWKNNRVSHWSIVKLFNLVLWRVKYDNHKLFVVSHRFSLYTAAQVMALHDLKDEKDKRKITGLDRICMFTVSFLNLANPCHTLIFVLRKCWKKSSIFIGHWTVFFPFWLIFLPFSFFCFLFLPPSLPPSILSFTHYNKLSEM